MYNETRGLVTKAVMRKNNKVMKIEGSKIGIRTFNNNDIALFYEAATESIVHMKEFMPWCHGVILNIQWKKAKNG